MARRGLVPAAAAAAAFGALTGASALSSALRGWNSWDNYLGAPAEADVDAIASYMASTLAPFGFDVLTLDAGWAVFGSNGSLSLDAFGRYTPRVDMYPSAAGGGGLSALSARLRALGLRLGVWTIRGIPRQAADAKTPIANSSFTADQAARTDRPCGWDSSCYGCAPDPSGAPGCNAAARAYYASLAQWYKDQGIALVKLDCMFPADHFPQGVYDDDDLSMTAAFRAAGLLISLSPGRNVSLTNATWVSTTGSADQFRVTEDFWDSWEDHYVSGVRTKLDVAVEFAPFFGANGTFPDLDMLPIGRIMSGQHPPLTSTNLTADEQTTVMTLWTVTGAPLIFGGRLPFDLSVPADALALSLLTNPEVLAVHNASSSRAPFTPGGGPQAYGWMAVPAGVPPPAVVVALFNGDDAPHTLKAQTASLGLPSGVDYCARDLWARAAVEGSFDTTFSAPVPLHGAGMWLITPCP
jgi:alpha-galactosidase